MLIVKYANTPDIHKVKSAQPRLPTGLLPVSVQSTSLVIFSEKAMVGLI